MRIIINNDDDGNLTDGNKIIVPCSERTRAEIWTRVMGYHRPVSEFNVGKQAEHAERKHFREPKF